MAFMNTQVTRGAASFVVTSTGMATEVGHISQMLSGQVSEETPLTKQLNSLTNQILVIAGVALAISVGLGLWRDQPFDAVFLTAVAFAVSAIPTGLPAVVTTVLAAGTSTLAKAGAIVKRLRSVETLGSTSAINSDKTGTLTLNQMTAVEMAIVGHRFTISGEGYSTTARSPARPAGRGAARALPAADGAVRRRGRQDGGWSATRPRAPRRARRQGRRGPGADPREVPADRRGAVRRRVQVHGHVPSR
jgi:magnesium-transporting ATPase (P-type)